MCNQCDALARKVMSVDAWDTTHAGHGPKTEEPFPHPSGTWFKVICPCGARHIRTRKEDAHAV